VDEGGTVESEVDGMLDTEVSRHLLVLPPLDEEAPALQPSEDGAGTVGTRVACQVNCTAGHQDGVSVVEGDIVIRQDEGEVNVATEEDTGVGPQGTGDVGDSEGMAKRLIDMGIGYNLVTRGGGSTRW